MENYLKIQPFFCPTNTDPFDTVGWETRTAEITGAEGTPVFRQENVEVPVSWSQLATNIVASKYFYGELGTPHREKSVRQLVERVCRTIADWGLADGYFNSEDDSDVFYRELCWLCLHQFAAFNSPVWFNLGITLRPPQTSACFIQSVEDSLDSIMELATNEAALFKYGSGTGTDLSTIRASCEKLSGGGKPSGPLSFMRIYDAIAGVVKSGGKTRRAAKMQSLRIDHPDILAFIEAKNREENKAKSLIQAGYSSDEAYASVPFQNANLSVRVTDEFMTAVENDEQWQTRHVTDPATPGPTYPAKELFGKIAQNAWSCGDPGLQFDTTINRWNTIPESGRINASNPCSEFMAVDNTACNLASVNLMKFRTDDGHFDHESFAAVCRLFICAQEILIDRSSYPTEQIAQNSKRFRPLGLGYTNLGALLMSLGHPYDSPNARGLCGVITAIMQGTAFRTSATLANVRGPFAEYEKNKVPMLDIIREYRKRALNLGYAPNYLHSAAATIWDSVIKEGEASGFRNSQVTVLAPTGTISFMMDCDTTGIEPEIALVKFKNLTGGGTFKMVNKTVPIALEALGYSKNKIDEIVKHIEKTGSVEDAPHLDPDFYPVFDCAIAAPGNSRSIDWRAHLEMMAAAQPFISGAISKTVNLPNDATPETVADAFTMAWHLGLKGGAIYRDGSKATQPLTTGEKKSQKRKHAPCLHREKLPDTRQSIIHKFTVGGFEGYLMVGLYPDGKPGELFITMSKNGSTIGGLMDSFATAVSMGLQYGVPLNVFIDKFEHTRFEPQGMTKNPDIPIAKSLVDYIFRWLKFRFIESPASDADTPPVSPIEPESAPLPQSSSDAPLCDACGSLTIRSGACYLCPNCGKSLGCS